ncbi:tetraspanin family protein, partial [bacterium]|nr:tetraspanin family protein [bacterium]
MFNLSFFNNIASLSQWRAPRRSIITRSVALLISLSFLMPTMSWAFDIKTYENNSSAKTRLFGPHDKRLAAEYRISPNMGKIVEAGFAPGDVTFILVQDLHCNYEIQTNIRSMLNHLMKKHPELKLVAVEGATGIIPTMELAMLPDSAVKRAVADYFMQEGKLTGADCLAILDSPAIELFGAEDPKLYDKSIDLIQAFGTGENRGLILELLDQLELLENQSYNQKLLVFEQRRRDFMQGDLDVEAYHHLLIQEAGSLKIALLPPALRGRGTGRLDYHDRESQDRYLEIEIHGQLAKTTAEKRLLGHRKYMEIVDRIVSVVASRKDIQVFQTQRGKVSLAGVLNLLQALPKESRYTTEEEIASLEEAVGKALTFYDLAEQRNHALLENTVQRARDRGENKVILVTGGFHTPAIIELIRNRGYSYVSLRPRMEKAGFSNSYFDLLRYPDQPTELERLLARHAAGVSAIALANHLGLPKFRAQFITAMDFMQEAVTQIQAHKSSTLEWGTLSLERVKKNLIQVVSPGAYTKPLVFRLGRHDITILRGEAARTAGQTNILASHKMRILSMGLLGMGLIPLVLSVFLPIVAAPVAAIAVGIALIGVGIWWTAAHFQTLLELPQTNPSLFERGIVISAILLPLTLLGFVAGTALGETINILGVGTPATNILLPGITAGIQQVLSLPILRDLTVYAHDPGMIRVWIGNTFSAFSILLLTVPFSIIGQITVMTRIPKVHVDTFSRKFGHPPYRHAGDIFARRVEKYDTDEWGTDDLRGSHMILSEDTMETMMGIVSVNGLRGLANQFSYRYSAKETAIPEEASIIGMPMMTRFMYSDPETPGSDCKVDAVLLVSMPKFGLPGEEMDKNGFAESKLPPEWVRGVLNGFNPGKQYEFYYEGAGLKNALPKAGEYEDYFKEKLELGRTKWGESGTDPISAEMNEEVFYQVVAEGILHEVVGHEPIFKLPDLIAQATPEDLLQDIRKEERGPILKAIQEERAAMPEAMRKEIQSFSFDAFLELIHSDPELNKCRSYYLSLIKGLDAVNEIEADIKITQEMVIREQALEMFCDRFGSMFFMENAHKIQACLTVLDREPGDNILHLMYRLDDARREGNLAQAIKTEVKVSDTIAKMMAEQLAPKLEASEKKHVFIKAYNEVGITENERKMYRKLLDYYIYLDEKNKLLNIPEMELKYNKLAAYQRSKLSDIGMGVVGKVIFQLTNNRSFQEFTTSIWEHLNRKAPYNVREISDTGGPIQSRPIEITGKRDSPIISSHGISVQPLDSEKAGDTKREGLTLPQVDQGKPNHPISRNINLNPKKAVNSSHVRESGQTIGDLHRNIISGVKQQSTEVAAPGSTQLTSQTTPSAPAAPTSPTGPLSPIQPMVPAATPLELRDAVAPALASSRAAELWSGIESLRQEFGTVAEVYTNDQHLAAALGDRGSISGETGLGNLGDVKINILPVDPKTGQLIGLPDPITGIVALTLEPGSGIPVVQSPEETGVLVDMIAIPIDGIPNSIDSATVQALITQSNQWQRELIKPDAFNDYILLTPGQAQTNYNLLHHYYQPIQCLVNIENTDFLEQLNLQDLPVEPQDHKARVMLEQVNQVLKKGLLVVYPSDIGKGFAAAASLRSMAKAADEMGLSPISLGPVDDMFGGSEQLKNLVKKKLSTEMPGKSALEKYAKEPLTEDQYMSFVAEVASFDQALVLGPKMHGTWWEVKNIFTPSAARNYILSPNGTRWPGRRVESAGEILPEDPTNFQSSKGMAKTFSVVVLGLAAGSLILRVLSRRVSKTALDEELKSQRLPIFQVMTHPSFIKALRLMARIITGNVGDLVGKHPLLAQQLADLQRIMDEGGNLEDLRSQPSKIPDSLKISLHLLIWIKNVLRKIPLFEEFLIWRGINLDSLQPELLMLVNEFIKIEAVTWYFTKQAHMRNQVVMRADGLPGELVKNLTISRAEAGSILSAANQELAQLRLKTRPTAGELARISELSTLIADMIFARRYQMLLQRMDKNYSPLLLARMIRTLLRELDRNGVTEEYRT